MTTKSHDAKHKQIPGAPAWVTPELLADTIEVWQPYYKEQLTVAEGLDIILCVSKLVDALTE